MKTEYYTGQGHRVGVLKCLSTVVSSYTQTGNEHLILWAQHYRSFPCSSTEKTDKENVTQTHRIDSLEKLFMLAPYITTRLNI